MPAPTTRTTLRRKSDRGRHDDETIRAILDEALVCHLGFAVDGRPWVFPTAFARIDDHVYVHGAAGNFALRTLAAGTEACLTVTIIDGLVLAKSAFHHSMNYRSVMVFGVGEQVTDASEKLAAVSAIVDHVVPGRSADTRAPSASELRSTLVVRFGLEECSAKVRSGPPIDDEEDLDLPHWAGVLPLGLQPSGAPAPAGAPAYVREWDRPSRGTRASWPH